MKPNAISLLEGRIVISSKQCPLFYNMVNKIFHNLKEHQDFVNWFTSRHGFEHQNFVPFIKIGMIKILLNAEVDR